MITHLPSAKDASITDIFWKGVKAGTVQKLSNFEYQAKGAYFDVTVRSFEMAVECFNREILKAGQLKIDTE